MKQNITENQLKALNDVQLEKFMGIKVDRDKFYFEGFADAFTIGRMIEYLERADRWKLGEVFELFADAIESVGNPILPDALCDVLWSKIVETLE